MKLPISLFLLFLIAIDVQGSAPSPTPAKDAANLYIDYGLRASQSHKTKEAIRYFTGGIQANPGDWRTYQFRAEEYLDAREWAKAAQDCTTVMRLMPTRVRPYSVRAIAYYYLGRDKDSLVDINTVIKTRPNEILLDPVLELRNRIYAAPLEFSAEAVRAASAKVNKEVAHARSSADKAKALNERAWLFATSPVKELRNGDQALQDASEACALTNRKDPYTLDTVAAAYAEKGNFAQAIATEGQALALSGKKPRLVRVETQHLNSYKSHRPYRMSAADRQPASESDRS